MADKKKIQFNIEAMGRGTFAYIINLANELEENSGLYSKILSIYFY